MWNISTHILTKRMTPIIENFFKLRKHFNSHPHEEDDEDSFETGLAVNYFNSHPHEEDDLF